MQQLVPRRVCENHRRGIQSIVWIHLQRMQTCPWYARAVLFVSQTVRWDTVLHMLRQMPGLVPWPLCRHIAERSRRHRRVHLPELSTQQFCEFCQHEGDGRQRIRKLEKTHQTNTGTIDASYIVYDATVNKLLAIVNIFRATKVHGHSWKPWIIMKHPTITF